MGTGVWADDGELFDVAGLFGFAECGLSEVWVGSEWFQEGIKVLLCIGHGHGEADVVCIWWYVIYEGPFVGVWY